MRLLTITALALAALPVAGSAAQVTPPETARFKIALHGVQRYASVHQEHAVHPERCYDSRGETISRTVVRFHTKRAARATLSGDRTYVAFRWSDPDLPIQVVADWTHSGAWNREVKSCAGTGQLWNPDVPPVVRNCHATLRNKGFMLSIVGDRVTAGGTQSIVPDVGPLFEGCPYGDTSLRLYDAKGTVDTMALLRGRETELVLRGKERERSEDPEGAGSTVVTRRTTVYVTLTRIGR